MASSVNIQPLIDLISHSGELTSEFKAAKTSGRVGMILWIASAIVTLLGMSGSVFPGSHLATVLGAIGTALGVIVQAGSGLHFASGRQNLKSDAQQALVGLSKAAAAGSVLLTGDQLGSVATATAPGVGQGTGTGVAMGVPAVPFAVPFGPAK